MARLAGGLDGTGLVHGIADHVHDAPQRLVADGDGDGVAGVGHLLAAREAFGGVHGDGAHRVLAQVLRHLEHQPPALVLGLQRVQDLRQVTVELHVDDGAHDLANATDFVGSHVFFLLPRPPARQVLAAARPNQ